MSYLVAITGKGGTGKTTVSACLVRLLVEKGIRPVFAVDADPNSTLAALLGVEVTQTISDIREQLLEEKAKVSGVPKPTLVEMGVEQSLVEAAGFDLLTMGRPEGRHCYCFVNSLLRTALASLQSNYKVTIVDNEAGMEHLSRMNTDNIDCLVIVSEPTMVSARTAVRIIQLAERLGVNVHHRVLAWNKVPPSGVPEAVREMLPKDCFDATVSLPLDEKLANLSALGESVTAADIPQAFDELLQACIADLQSAISE